MAEPQVQDSTQAMLLSESSIFLPGSAVAFGKLHGVLASKPLNLPGKNLANIALAAGNVAAGAAFLTSGDPSTGVAMLAATSALGGVMGAHMTASIGGVGSASPPKAHASVSRFELKPSDLELALLTLLKQALCPW